MSTGGRLTAGVLWWLLVPGMIGSAFAQIAPRLTGEAILTELEMARQELATRSATLPQSSLATTSGRVANLAGTLRKTLGRDASKPIDLISADRKSTRLNSSH